jgi:hypothetical protein
MNLSEIRKKLTSAASGIKVLPLAAGAAATAVMASASPSHAGLTELFAAADIAGVSTSIETFLIALVGIGLLFFGYILLKKLRVGV